MHFAALFLQSAADQEEVQKLVLAVFAIMPILILLGLAIVIVPTWFICKKAGFSPWLSLLNIVPCGTLILLYILAFADWRVAPATPVTPTWIPPVPPPPQA